MKVLIRSTEIRSSCRGRTAATVDRQQPRLRREDYNHVNHNEWALIGPADIGLDPDASDEMFEAAMGWWGD